jgi:hypothetical protein
LKRRWKYLAVILLAAAAGCAGPIDGPKPEVLTVDFKQGQSLRYKFVSSRESVLDWSAGQDGGKASKGSIDKLLERMEMVVAYKPIKVDPYGLTTINAKVESVKAQRTSPRSKKLRDAKDAVKSFAGKSFSFTVAPDGTIKDHSQLEALLKQAGEKAFRRRAGQGRIKEPDMIHDFITSQWFLWDTVSSIEEPTRGVFLGQSWGSQLPVPLPMVMRAARDANYTLGSIRETENGRIAVISSSFSPAKSVTAGWPSPYAAGSFQVSRTFGMLRRFRILELQGQGEELFNIDKGRIEQYNHSHKVKISASLLLPLPGANPQVTIDQKLSMKLVGD